MHVQHRLAAPLDFFSYAFCTLIDSACPHAHAFHVNITSFSSLFTQAMGRVVNLSH